MTGKSSGEEICDHTLAAGPQLVPDFSVQVLGAAEVRGFDGVERADHPGVLYPTDRRPGLVRAVCMIFVAGVSPVTDMTTKGLGLAWYGMDPVHYSLGTTMYSRGNVARTKFILVSLPLRYPVRSWQPSTRIQQGRQLEQSRCNTFEQQLLGWIRDGLYCG